MRKRAGKTLMSLRSHHHCVTLWEEHRLCVCQTPSHAHVADKPSTLTREGAFRGQETAPPGKVS